MAEKTNLDNWAGQARTNLDKWLYLVRRIEEHREEDAVKKLKRLYKSLIKDLRKSMGDVYADHADPETGALSYAELHRLGLDARLLEEGASRMNDVTQEEKRIITETVEQTYANCYSGMVQAVEKAVDNDELRAAFSTVEAVKPEVLRAAVNNPVHGLTLSDQLEKNRADIIYSIKQAVGVGLSQGDRYDTMARRIQQTLIGPDGAGGSYYKAVRIARTEAHRVREEGNLDAAQNLTEQLEPAGITMVKTWHTMKDERVRPNRARKTKGGWKYSKGGKYDHVSMEGVQVGINEEFKLPSGAKTQAPGKSGVAGEDINCRCFLSYDVVKAIKIESPSSPQSLARSLEAIRNKKAGLSTARKDMLKRVPQSGEYGRFPREKISVHDLAYLSAETGHEFSLFRGKKEDILVHGDQLTCNLYGEIVDELIAGGYEWIAHSHVDMGNLVASRADRNTLRLFKQKKSIIIGPTGKEITFTQSEFD